MDDADYMSPTELMGWLAVYAPPRAAAAAKRLLDGAETASKEVVRLQQVIQDHTRKLSAPVASQYYADLTIEQNPQFCATETRIRLRPMLHEIRVPFEVGNWSDDFKRAFCDQVATDVGQTAGRRLAKELWPTLPAP